MNYYIIAAGGTGAMCVRSFIYLAAAGCAKDFDTYHILLVDKDTKSDAVTACENLLEDYNVMYDQLRNDKFTFPKITLHKWSFTEAIMDEYESKTGKLAENLSTLTLDKLLNPDHDPNTARLLNTMYTEAELNTDLKNGFYGHPNIGAPVFDYIRDRFLDPKDNAFMNSLRADLSKGKAYVYLFGSLFGGTGATVIPNVVLSLRSIKGTDGTAIGKNNLILGGSMVMPYFKLPQMKPDCLDKLEKLVPEDTKFADQTKEALDYYDSSQLLKEMMNLTLVGSSELDVTSEIFARGGTQHQHFHMVLMMAAVAANRFFAKNLGGMAAVNVDNSTPITPLGELILWKFTPGDPGNQGNYASLTASELGLNTELKQMTSFLRFSVVVAFYMRKRFDEVSWDRLCKDVEVQGTIRQMSADVGRELDPKKLTNTDFETYYKLPVQKAGAICRGFIEFFFDVALSGYDWSKFRDYYRDENRAQKVGTNTYYPYVQGAISEDVEKTFSTRWVDIANVNILMEILKTADPLNVLTRYSLNDICSFSYLDQARGGVKEKDYPDNIGQVYQNSLERLPREKGTFGFKGKVNAKFSDIYAQLRQMCQEGGRV